MHGDTTGRRRHSSVRDPGAPGAAPELPEITCAGRGRGRDPQAGGAGRRREPRQRARRGRREAERGSTEQ
ncbi:hypothetical protein P7K49_015700, partial [Saguinus oedipus]